MVKKSAVKKINLTKNAESALAFLNEQDRENADRLLRDISEVASLESDEASSYQPKLVGKNMFALKLSAQLRMIVEVLDESIRVLDVINSNLFIKYSKSA